MDAAVIRLIVSQAFLLVYFLILIPLKPPVNLNIIRVSLVALSLTGLNGFVILQFGLLDVYIRFYFFTLMLPYLVLLSFFVKYSGWRLLFAILSVQVFGNIAIVNGMFASSLFYGADAPLTDTLVRSLTYVFFLPILYYFVRPQYIQMVTFLSRGWAMLCFILGLSYMMTYLILFSPNPILYRPEYFLHAYFVLFVSLLIYAIIFLLFHEIEARLHTERDNQVLSVQVSALETQSKTVLENEEKLKIQRHDMRHHLSILENHLKDGDTKAALTFLNTYDQSLSESPLQRYCENHVVNAAIRYYVDDAQSHHIQVTVLCDVPQTIPWPSAELAIVFANALENAIHACKKIEDPAQRSLQIVCRYQPHSFVLEVENSTATPVFFDSKRVPIATEKDHGTGVLSMLAFAKKYDALLTFSQENDRFYLRMLIQA